MPTTPLTDQQRQAVTMREVSVVLSSGAGCGKTHVLTERYLSHLEVDGAEVGQIVAITFTERAAREMRGRIRAEVSRRLRGATTDSEAEKWTHHLRALEAAPISTIHAFCGTLLRQHAVEAGLDARFEILEQVLTINLETEAMHTCLQQLLTAQATAGEDLRELVLLFGWRSVSEGIRSLLSAWDGSRWQHWLELSPEAIATDWLDQARRVIVPDYVKYLLDGQPAVAHCLSLLKRHPPREGPLVASVQQLQEAVVRLPSAPDLSVAVKEMIELAKVGRGGPKAWPDSDVYEEIKKAFENFRSTLSKLKLEGFTPAPSELETAIVVGQRLVRVVREVQRTYADRKRYLGVVDFQDLVMLTRDLLSQRADIRARLQDRYRFVLLDEMQDTDPVQGELLDLVCGPRKNEGKLFAVGDANQSIYRFRGADVSLFQNLRQAVAHTGRLGLSINFRSQPAILDFANALVGHRLADYESLRAHHPQLNPNPCVEFLWAPRAEKESVTRSRMEEASWIARRLAAMIGRESLVVERVQGKADVLRPVQAGDIVLLFRAMSNVSLYEAALREAGLDYYLVGGRAFFAQQEIYDLLNLLRALENPQDKVNLAGTLRSPFCCLSDESLYILGRHAEGLWAGLNDPTLESRLPRDQRATVARARQHLQRWRQWKDRMPIARLLGAVFADSGFDAATQLEYLADRKLANLWKLQDLARTFDRSGLFGLADFIVRLNEMVNSQAREEQAATQPEKADVIKLMSIHQAKGLEFPVVVIPDFAASTRGDSLPIAHWEQNLGCVVRPPSDEEEPAFADFGYRLWQAQNEVEQWHEDQRILYVACTRAKDYLILSSSLSEGARASNSWMLTLQERFDLQTGQCLVADLEEGHVPRVRVFDSLSPPPAERALTTSTASPDVLLEHLDPEPARHVVPPQLDTYKVLDLADLFPARAARGPEETLLRLLLANCGGPEPDRWRGLLVSLTEGWEPARCAGLEMILQRIIELDVVRQFLETETRQDDVDYWLHLPPNDAAAQTTPHPVVHGRIDGLWQDEAGAWHLLTWSWRPEQLPDAQAAWETEVGSLTLAACALRQQLGTWPAYVHLVILPFGLVVTKRGRYLPHRQVMADLREQLGLASRGGIVS